MGNYLDTRDLYKRQCELQSDLADLTDELSDAEEAYTDAKDNLRDGLYEGAFDQLTICNLREEIEDLAADRREAEKALQDWQDEYQEELTELNPLEDEVGDEWRHGTTLIPEDDFIEYAQDLAEDIGAIDRNAHWPLNCIDWEQAASELRMDYSECEYQGTTYLFRS